MPPLKANMWLTMWSMVAGWPHSHLDVPFMHQMSASFMQSSDVVDGCPLALSEVKPRRFGYSGQDKIIVSGVC